ncbi:MAG: hypothetical protein KA297_03290 [Kofleriaceae bacterium]|nr:hypothetical protein [Kofleriaceae bacterium]
MPAEFEPVFTVPDWYDGPRSGIASVGGVPHHYTSTFADLDAGGGPDVFELRPVDDETFRLALEDWDIWLRWHDAHAAGLTPIETHPALPGDRPRHDVLAPLLGARLAALAGPSARAHAEFRQAPDRPAERWRGLEVRWTMVS